MQVAMTGLAHDVHYTFTEYVLFERTSNVKHEYLHGQIYAMAGGTPEHAALAAAVNGLLFAQLRGTSCRAYSSDLRVRAGKLTTYPDVTVICGLVIGDPEDPSTATNPALVVEVTSPSTEAYDRGEKLQHYQTIETLQCIVLVSHSEAHFELYRRSGSEWLKSEAGAKETIALPAIGCTLAVDDVYGAVARS
jgi:Uma2 family endonuclease